MPDSRDTISGAQIRAARAMLRMEQRELARRAGVSVETIKRLERMEGPIRATEETIVSVHGALESAGVEFTFEDDYYAGEGVQLIKPGESDWIRNVVEEYLDHYAGYALVGAYYSDPNLSSKSPSDIIEKWFSVMLDPEEKANVIERLAAAIDRERQKRDDARRHRAQGV